MKHSSCLCFPSLSVCYVKCTASLHKAQSDDVSPVRHTKAWKVWHALVNTQFWWLRELLGLVVDIYATFRSKAASHQKSHAKSHVESPKQRRRDSTTHSSRIIQLDAMIFLCLLVAVLHRFDRIMALTESIGELSPSLVWQLRQV